MRCAPSSDHLSSKAGTISCYLLSLMPEVAKSKIAAFIGVKSVRHIIPRR
jgi:hypothetical protein